MGGCYVVYISEYIYSGARGNTEIVYVIRNSFGTSVRVPDAESRFCACEKARGEIATQNNTIYIGIIRCASKSMRYNNHTHTPLLSFSLSIKLYTSSRTHPADMRARRTRIFSCGMDSNSAICIFKSLDGRGRERDAPRRRGSVSASSARKEIFQKAIAQ